MGKVQNQSKRDKFTQPRKKNNTPIYVFTGIAVVVLAVGGFYFFGNKNSEVDSKATASIGQSVNYNANDKLQQTKVANKVENGKVTLTTRTDLKEKKFIWTEYKANGKRVPLTAIAEPSGKIVVAVSVCEPCKGESFHISGNTLVCNVCGTTWNLESFKGLSGGCQDYPPEVLQYTQNGDNIEVDQAKLDAWKPRV
ncbi:DUF2318 domain-containing protein [Desulfitobacterium metallireducens]|uniref:Membrane protein n=1 Tax=Desulfitobacterium metallireducens DSM 15288 TaxID=871968 RepID=W0E530_9FIRM|nr:DUF2318 domain-containing protein [Desulfitobacterium metallireducens]AHF05975.1 membrane protein [Desulfitobacterium metallireducens DSM 15288]